MSYSMKQYAIEKGYVPKTCALPGLMIRGYLVKGIDPCDDCGHDREKCLGRPEKTKD